MEYVTIVVVLLALFIGFMLKGWFDEKRFFKRIASKLSDEFGKNPTRQYNVDDIANIKKHFYRDLGATCIDDITAEDLSLDDVYKRLNYSQSTMGDTMLYKVLREPLTNEEEIKDRGKKIDWFHKNPDETSSLRFFFFRIGRMNKVSFFDCIDYFDTIEEKSCIKDYLCFIFTAVSIALIFFVPPLGILLLVSTFVYNIVSYYSARGTIEPYVLTFTFINKFIKSAALLKGRKIDIISKELSAIDDYVTKLKPFTKRAGRIVSKSSQVGAGNPFEILADYGKMLFHIDIINFYKMLSFVKENMELIEGLYNELGMVEVYLDIAMYRASADVFATPEFGGSLSLVNAYHPLIKDPVKNSVDSKRSVLLTGSNASGKSTFLKTVAINILFAQTIDTVLCDNYTGDLYSLFSSMSLRDNLEGDSYFMVEIKAIKRILDFAMANPDKKTVCFVDEVLRGTNTVERISASTEILRHFSDLGVLCFAATHDGELTFLLEDCFDNYHFEEEILDNDVLFNYKLNPGRATSRNAIKLLSVMGFEDSIVNNASKRAEAFLEKGLWEA